MTNIGIKIEQGDNVIAFYLALNIANEFYIMSRISLSQGMTEAGCLLAHQSLESYIKSIIRLEPEEPEHKHDLIWLIEHSNNAGLKRILLNPDQKNFLGELYKAYKWSRFGTAKSNISSELMLPVLDSLSLELREIYFNTIGASEGRLYVPKDLELSFLKENKVYTSKNISNDLLTRVMPF